MTLHRASRYTLVLAVLMCPAFAGAQGFGLNEIGSCATSRGFAVTGAPCDDASSIYWNPGALPSKNGFSFLGGAAMIKINADFTRDTTYQRYQADAPTAYVPHVFLNYRSGAYAYGLGVYVPYGLTSQWGNDFPGRFEAQKASLQTIYIQPNIAYQISQNWSIGGGPVIGHSNVELLQSLDLSTQFAQPGVTFGNLGIAKYTEFGKADLKGSAMAYGVDLGLHGKITPTWEMGVRFLSQLSFNYDNADATFTETATGLTLAAANPLGVPAGTPVDALVAPEFAAGGPLSAQKVSTQIRDPAQVQVGFGYTGFQNMTLSMDLAYVGWKSFKLLPVTFLGPAAASSRVLEEDYNNTTSFRVGAERRYSSGAALRGGFTATASAAPPETVTPLLPEMDRQIGAIGGYLPLFSGFGLDASYSHIFTGGSRGRLDERVVGSTQAAALALSDGAYTLDANVVSISIKKSF